MSPFFYEYIVYKHIIYNMNKFEKWLNAINEELASEPAIAAEPVVSSSAPSNREAMMSDVDNIMTSLETLAGELQEELTMEEGDEVNEAGNLDALGIAGAAGAAATGLAARQLVLWGKIPGARKKQAKVNAILLKIAQLEDAVGAAETGPQKENIESKIETLKKQAEDAQDQIDLKYTADTIKKAIAAERLKGKIEVAKYKMDGATPAQQAELKASLMKYADSYKKNVAALKAAEPKKEEKPKDKEEPRVKEEPKSSTEEAPESGAAAAAEKTDAEKEAQLEDSISQYDSNIETEMARVSKLNNDLSDAEKEKEASTKPDEVEKKINSIKAEIGKSKEDINQMKAAKEKLKKQLSPKESLVIRAMATSLNELAIEISEKAEWQLEGTVLYTKYDSMLRKVEATNYLTESRSMTIKDKFSKLL